ncbi:MAG TPA: GIY-YIG nuclease family protein [Flavipsychrobacter sp.]|nr:GIY-YIG nuclease family protein [Flavipsychrobacter sp.]
MIYSVYIIFSAKLDKYYVGYTEDLMVRLAQHNEGISDFTSVAQDWILVYSQPFETREAARKREIEIKKKKSRKYLEWLISSAG